MKLIEILILVHDSFLGVLGLITAIICLGIYHCLKKSEEISMVSFLFHPKKIFKEVKIRFSISVILLMGYILFFFWQFSYFGILPEFLPEDLVNFSVFSASVLYAVGWTIVAWRWWRRFERYV